MSIYTFDRHWSGLASNLVRWRIRQDGFVSWHGAYAGQKVVTKPLVFTGSEMLVNFSTSARGRMFVTTPFAQKYPLDRRGEEMIYYTSIRPRWAGRSE